MNAATVTRQDNTTILQATPDGQPRYDDLAYLDGLRGLAALYVLLHHAHWLLWEGFSSGFVTHPDQYSMLGKLLAYASVSLNYGHQAVLFFFVLSGFVIHLRYARALQQDSLSARFDWASFIYRRFKRIYPAFLLAIILTFCLDQFGISRNYPIYSRQTPYPLINLNMNADYSGDNLLRTLLFLNTSSEVPSWGINGPLWSLRMEWWFYMLYPLFWLLTKRSIRLATGTLAILFVLTFIQNLWTLPLISLFQSVFTWMIVWWFGSLLAEIYVGRLTIPFSRIALLAVLFLILPFLVAPFVDWSTGIQDFVWGLGFTGLLAVFLALSKRGKKIYLLAQLKPLGDFSYTLYACHFPILVLISGWLMTQSPDHSLPQHFGWIVWGSLICLSFAYIAHFVVEKPFTRRRKPIIDLVQKPIMGS